MCFEQSLVLLLAWRQTDKLIPDEPMATPMSYAIREQGSISQTIFFHRNSNAMEIYILL